MNDREKEAYEETLDALVLRLHAEQRRALKDMERWANGNHPDGAKFPPMSETRERERNRRMAGHSQAEARAFQHARETIEELLHDGPKHPLDDKDLQSFERKVTEAFRDSAKVTEMVKAFCSFTRVQKHQAWRHVTGREPNDAKQGSFMAEHLRHLIV